MEFLEVYCFIPVFKDFSVVFLLLISSLSPLWSVCTLYYFSSFKFFEVCFMAQDMVCLGECSMGASKEVCILLLLVEYSVYVN